MAVAQPPRLCDAATDIDPGPERMSANSIGLDCSKPTVECTAFGNVCHFTKIKTDVLLTGSVLQQFTFPELKEITGQLRIRSCQQLQMIDMPKLGTIGGLLYVGLNSVLTSISMPLLNETGRVATGFSEVDNNAILPAFELPSLTSIYSDLNFITNGAMTTIKLHSLIMVDGSFSLQQMTSVSTLEIAALRHGVIAIPSIPSLTSVKICTADLRHPPILADNLLPCGYPSDVACLVCQASLTSTPSCTADCVTPPPTAAPTSVIVTNSPTVAGLQMLPAVIEADLVIEASVVISSPIDISSLGKVTIHGSLTLLNSARLSVSSESLSINASQSAVLRGTLAITLTAKPAPLAPLTVPVLRAASISGDFSAIDVKIAATQAALLPCESLNYGAPDSYPGGTYSVTVSLNSDECSPLSVPVIAGIAVGVVAVAAVSVIAGVMLHRRRVAARTSQKNAEIKDKDFAELQEHYSRPNSLNEALIDK